MTVIQKVNLTLNSVFWWF